MKKNQQKSFISAHVSFTQDKSTTNDKTSNAYYEQKSKEVIEQAITEATEQGKSLKEIRFLMRRSYPFGALRKGRPYKIWNRLVLAKEAELGLEPRKHKPKQSIGVSS